HLHRTPSLTHFPYTTLFRSISIIRTRAQFTFRRMAREIAGKQPGERDEARVEHFALRLLAPRRFAAAPHRSDRFTCNARPALRRSEEHTSALQSRANLVYRI